MFDLNFIKIKPNTTFTYILSFILFMYLFSNNIIEESKFGSAADLASAASKVAKSGDDAADASASLFSRLKKGAIRNPKTALGVGAGATFGGYTLAKGQSPSDTIEDIGDASSDVVESTAEAVGGAAGDVAVGLGKGLSNSLPPGLNPGNWFEGFGETFQYIFYGLIGLFVLFLVIMLVMKISRKTKRNY